MSSSGERLFKFELNKKQLHPSLQCQVKSYDPPSLWMCISKSATLTTEVAVRERLWSLPASKIISLVLFKSLYSHGVALFLRGRGRGRGKSSRYKQRKRQRSECNWFPCSWLAGIAFSDSLQGFVSHLESQCCERMHTERAASGPLRSCWIWPKKKKKKYWIRITDFNGKFHSMSMSGEAPLSTNISFGAAQ